MNTKINEIQTSLDNTNKRISELIATKNEISVELEQTQNSFIERKSSLDDVSNLQQKLMILDKSISSLESRRDELQTAFNEAQKASERSEVLSRMETTANEGKEAFDAYITARNEFDSVVRDRAEKAFEALLNFRAKQADFAADFRAIEPSLVTFQPSANDSVAYSRVANDLSEAGLPFEEIKLLTAADLPLPQIEQPQIFHMAQTFVSQNYRSRQRHALESELEAEREKKRKEREADEQKAKDELSKQIAEERQRIIQYRIAEQLPALSEKELSFAAKESYAKKIEAKARGAKV